MSDSLSSILSNKSFEEPPEIAAVKAYVLRHFKTTPSIILRDQQLIVCVPSAAMAGALRLHAHKIKQECGLEKRLVIRIGA